MEIVNEINTRHSLFTVMTEIKPLGT